MHVEHSVGGIGMTRSLRLGTAVASLMLAAPAVEGLAAQMTAPNPYETVEGVWAELPDGRTWGSTSAVYPAPDGMSIWVADRCGANSCEDSDVDPILRYDLDGNLLTSFGAGQVVWPHGMHVDTEGNVWIADAVGFGETPEGRGHVVLKFSAEGELLMTLGEDGVAGTDRQRFTRPNDVYVAPDGSIFVADGHRGRGEANNRIMKFDAEGNFLLEWGTTGGGTGEFDEPHGLAMDSDGRLFVADRYNNRIQIFDQEGAHLATWTQFSRLSGIFIKDDVLYAADSESNMRRNPGWKRGIYIGDVKTGWVTAFIPDSEPDQDNSGTSGAEGVAVDAMGNVYGAEVGPRMLRKYIRRQ
jgi:sugar lactone lactonase YvrE